MSTEGTALFTPPRIVHRHPDGEVTIPSCTDTSFNEVSHPTGQWTRAIDVLQQYKVCALTSFDDLKPQDWKRGTRPKLGSDTDSTALGQRYAESLERLLRWTALQKDAAPWATAVLGVAALTATIACRVAYLRARAP